MEYKIGDKVKLCACGCGEWIIYKRHHKYYGIPHFISDHDKKLNPCMGMLGKHHSIKSRKQMSNTHHLQYERGERVSSFKDKTWEEIFGEEKAKQLKINTGERSRKLFLGVPKSGEHLRKLRERLAIFNRSEKQRKAVSKSRTGTKESPERIEQKRIEALTNLNIRKGWFKKGEPSRGIPWIKGQFAGNKNNQWIDGRSLIPYSYEFKLKKKEIYKRDRRTCQFCGRLIEKNLDNLNRIAVHHIDYNKSNNSEDNLITLCNLCHLKTNGNREYWTNYFKEFLSNKYNYHIINPLLSESNKKIPNDMGYIMMGGLKK